MYNFYYDVPKAKCGDKVGLLYTDTDSLNVDIQTEDAYEDFRQPDMRDRFDFREVHLLRCLQKGARRRRSNKSELQLNQKCKASTTHNEHHQRRLDRLPQQKTVLRQCEISCLWS